MKGTKKRFPVSLANAISQSWQDKDIRLWKRLKAIGLYLHGHHPEDICHSLDVSRRSIFYWLEHYDGSGVEGLREGEHPGRPAGLNVQELDRLAEILDSGPVAYGFSSGVWTCSRVGHIIQEEFGRGYHEDHVRKILHRLGFSVQRPTKKLAQANPQWQQRWIRHTYPTLKKTPKRKRDSAVSG
jgi:transposase